MATERSVKVRLNADPSGFIAGFRTARTAVKDLRRDIDTTNDRTAWLAQSFLALAPALGPISAAAVPALAGIATQLTITGLAAGTLTLAFNGIGDALKALNDYQIDPTDAHLKKLHETMAKIGPTGRDLVKDLDRMRDGFVGLSNLARDNMFPGVTEGLHEMAVLFPQVQQIVAKTAAELGDLADLAGERLGGPRFEAFFDFLEADAAPTLDAMARTIGNFADGLAAMLVAFRPLSHDFTSGMLEMSRSFADWAHGLEDSQSFQDFVDYVQENTPKVMALIGQLAETFVDIVTAAAPVGEVMIPLLTGILNVVQALADTPLGPIFIAAAAAMSVYGRAVALASITTGGLFGKAIRAATGYDKLRAALRLTETELTATTVSAEVLGDTMVAATGKAEMLGTRARTAVALLGDAMSVASAKSAFLGNSTVASVTRADKAISAASTKAIILGDDLAAIARKDSVPASVKAQIMFESSLGASDVAAKKLAADLTVVNTKAERLTYAGRPVQAFGRDLTAVERPAERGARSVGKLGGALAGSAGQIGLFALAMSPLPEKIGATNAATGALIGSMGGPLGAVIGAAAGEAYDLSKAYFKAATATKEFKGDTDGLAATLDQQTGAITKNTRAYVENELAKQGAIEAGKDIGVSSDMLVDAYLGDALAIERVNRALTTVNSTFYDSEGRVVVSAKKLDEYRGSLELVSSVLGVGTQALDDARGSLILTGNDVDTTTRKFHAITEAVDEFGDAVTDLDAKLDKRSKYRNYQQALDDLAKSLKDNGTSLDSDTQKGRDNQAQLDDLANSIKEVASGLSGDRRQTFLKGAIKEFDDLAGKFDIAKGGLKGLKDRLGLLDLVKAEPEVRVKGTGKAEGEIDHIGQIMDHLDGKVVNPRVIISTYFHAKNTGNQFGSGPGFADGGWTGNLPVHQKAGDVHGQEYVVRAPFASIFRSELEARFPRRGKAAGSYEGGGFVTPTPTVASPQGTGFGDRELALVGAAAGEAAAREARPMFDNNHWHSEGDVKRAMAMARRLSAKRT